MMGAESQYSLMVGMMYVFNSMFGVGILALPKAFADAGWLASSVILALAMVMSYITVTFLIEVMSSANARIIWDRSNDSHQENEMILKENISMSAKRGEESTQSKALHSEFSSKYICCCYCLPDDPKPSVFDINELLSLTDLTKMYFSTVGDLLSRITLMLGIYGSLAMFLTMVPFSLMELFCNIPSCTGESNFTSNSYDENHCWGPISRINAYRIFLAGFVLLIGPFAFFSIQKNKFIQLFATIVSFSVFCIMFITALHLLAIGRGKGNPALANFSALPNIFGACSLAAVSHATLPHIIPPILNKANLGLGIAIVFIVVGAFYALLSLTIMFTFENDKIQEIVLLNFFDCLIVPGVFFIYFLGLYTTFKVSAIFPLNAVALRDNIWAMFSSFQCSRIWAVERLLFPLLAIIPPTVIAVVTENIEAIVGITGSYAATTIQFIIPPLLVHYSRTDTQEKFGPSVRIKHASPFQHKFWIILAIIFAVFTITTVTILYITHQS
ncbi:transmembrane protein 104-like [Gopherus flavomarginatus]|uniref:transmembrane protein 104-like n=1 Tax=Gopherus flavomarginatus TaxID=286002 RepID=UPI0021CBAA5B|nr:transmembrane protein 104-like [Gopherus flavomarginatus]